MENAVRGDIEDAGKRKCHSPIKGCDVCGASNFVKDKGGGTRRLILPALSEPLICIPRPL
ncbi:MAG: hypothetical protein PVJ39_05705 [Gammaproteobacteria bacterium]